MNDYLKVTVAQSPAQLCGQQERLKWLEQQLEAIHKNSVDLFILPELFLSGYNIGKKLIDEGIEKSSPIFEKISSLAKKHHTAIHFGYPEKSEDRLYNSASCISKTGELLTTHRKLIFPPGFESDFFTPGSDYQIFQINNFTISTLICYDAEFPENFRRLLNSDLIVVPTALSFKWGVVANKVIPARAFENGVYICYADHDGIENTLKYYGSSCIIAPDGSDIARANKNEPIISAVLDKKMIKESRQQLPYHIDRLRLPIPSTANDCT